MRTLVVVGMAVGLIGGFGATHTGDVRACDRALSPLEDLPVAVAVADEIVLVEALEVAGKTARVRVLEHLAGALAVGADVTIASQEDMADEPMRRWCGGATLAPKQRVWLLLWRPARPGAPYDLIDGVAGLHHGEVPALRQALEAARAAARPASAWREADGLATRLVALPAEPSDPPGDVNLLVIARNVGAAPRTYTYESWPRAAQSRCTLDVVHVASGAAVAPVPVPIAPADIDAYFAAHGTRYEVAVPPGAAALIALDRTTTAVMGWGYKERLGFMHWPVAPERTGLHRVAATCERFFGPGSRLTTGPLEVVAGPGARGR